MISRYSVFAGIALTLLVVASSVWNVNHLENHAKYLATEEARANWNKDQAFRRWATRHGGLYVRPDERTPPNPYLEHLPNRDVVTTDGVKLTLMNPAYMMSQMTKEFESMYGIKGKITGQILLNPKNEADPWELNALKQFDEGVKEVSEQTDIDGSPYLRLMRPMVMKKGCVLCHGHLGFKVGDIRGGVSISVPLTPYFAAAQESKTYLISTHGVVWIIGMLTIGLVSWRGQKREIERRQVEEALRESENRFRSLIDASPSAISLKDEEGRYLLVNQSWETMFGGSKEEVKGKFPEDVLPESVVESSQQHDQITFETGQMSTKEEEVYLEGNPHTLLSIKFPILDDKGNVKGIGSLATDITERIKAEKALQESEERFRTVVEATTVVVWTTDPDGGFAEPQLSWQEHTGQPWPEHQGFGWTKMIHPDNIEEIRRGWEHSLNTLTAFMAEGRLWSASENTYRYFTVRAAPLLNKDGSVQKWVGTIADTHDRKVAEEATKASEARLKGILDIAPEAVIAIGEHFNIRLFNQGAERIFGYIADEVMGRPLDILMPERYRRAHSKHVEAFSGSGDTYRLMDQRQELYGLKKDGTEFPAAASVSKLNISGETIFTVLLHDISDRKQAEEAIVSSKEEAEIANYAKTQFLANMSHELRTPLNSIIGFSQILMGQGLGKLNFSQSSGYAENINESANHLLALIQDILDVSKIEAQELDLEKEPIDFRKLIDDCFMMLQERADKGGVKLSYTIADGVPFINADEVRLKQVLLNLLSNAIKFTLEGGKAGVSVKANEEGRVCLKVEDNGIGIRKNDIPKVLLPFGQAKDVLNRNHEGTGLGLSLAKSLVELHGGSLEITSEVGEGTTVVVELPNGDA
ncbi:MAG: PAS domain S-box protein [Rhodospirillales bacterium]|nr:PAS domain S-box protein [Rhodospirillales bacterium]